MHLREGEYEKAHTDFFEAFKNYDESGSPRYINGCFIFLSETIEMGLRSKFQKMHQFRTVE